MSTPIEIVEINGLSVTRAERDGVVYQHVSTPVEIQLHNDLTTLRARLAEVEAELKRQLGLWHSTFALGLDERDFAIACIERTLANKRTIDNATHAEWEKANQTHCFKNNGDFAYRAALSGGKEAT